MIYGLKTLIFLKVTFLNLDVMVLNVDEISCNFKFLLLISSYIHLKKNSAKWKNEGQNKHPNIHNKSLWFLGSRRLVLGM